MTRAARPTRRGAGDDQQAGIPARVSWRDGRDVPCSRGPDDPCQRIADDRKWAGRLCRHFLGGRLVPAGGDDRRTAVRAPRRSLRPQTHAARRAGHIFGRLARLRAGAEAAAADRGAGRAGAGRRRPDDAGAGFDRRTRIAARARQVFRLLRHRFRAGEHVGPGARRVPYRARELARDFRHQHPARHRRRSARVAHPRRAAGARGPLPARHRRCVAVFARDAVRCFLRFRREVTVLRGLHGRCSCWWPSPLRVSRCCCDGSVAPPIR